MTGKFDNELIYDFSDSANNIMSEKYTYKRQQYFYHECVLLSGCRKNEPSNNPLSF